MQVRDCEQFGVINKTNKKSKKFEKSCSNKTNVLIIHNICLIKSILVKNNYAKMFILTLCSCCVCTTPKGLVTSPVLILFQS